MKGTLTPYVPTNLPAPRQRPYDRLAVTAAWVALMPWVFTGYSMLAERTTLPYPDERLVSAVILALPVGFVLGLIAAVRIGRHGDQRRGLALAIGAMVLPIAFVVLAVVVVVGEWAEEGLSTIGVGVGPPPVG